MITEEMLREAAAKASEALVAYYEKSYDPQNQPAPPPEFEKRIQDLKCGKCQASRISFAASSKDCSVIYSYQNGDNRHLLPFWYLSISR